MGDLADCIVTELRDGNRLGWDRRDLAESIERVCLEWVRQQLAEVRALYPEDVFPPDSPSPDARAAAGCRVALDALSARLFGVGEEPPPVPLQEKD